MMSTLVDREANRRSDDPVRASEITRSRVQEIDRKRDEIERMGLVADKRSNHHGDSMECDSTTRITLTASLNNDYLYI